MWGAGGQGRPGPATLDPLQLLCCAEDFGLPLFTLRGGIRPAAGAHIPGSVLRCSSAEFALAVLAGANDLHHSFGCRSLPSGLWQVSSDCLQNAPKSPVEGPGRMGRWVGRDRVPSLGREVGRDGMVGRAGKSCSALPSLVRESGGDGVWESGGYGVVGRFGKLCSGLPSLVREIGGDGAPQEAAQEETQERYTDQWLPRPCIMQFESVMLSCGHGAKCEVR